MYQTHAINLRGLLCYI